MRTVFILLFDGFSDWEISYASAELNKSENIDLKYFTSDGRSITSMGGMRIQPAESIASIKVDEIDMLILPGGSAWEDDSIKDLDGLIDSYLREGKSIAAICAATTFLARKGYLDQVKHTSNAPGYLGQLARNYKGDENYVMIPALTDQNFITANGTAPIEFAREIFKKVELFPEEEIEKWYQLFKYGIWVE